MGQAERLSTYKTCPVCGNDLPPQKTTGRPRVFCGDACRRLDQTLGWLEDQLQTVQPTKEKKIKLRGRLWYLANLLNAKNRSGNHEQGEARE